MHPFERFKEKCCERKKCKHSCCCNCDVKVIIKHGPQGPQGCQGRIGIQGFQGLSQAGFQGWQGLQGEGLQGFQGPIQSGPQGFQGWQGFQGTGFQGFQGPIQSGPQGFQGFGSQGFQGYQGPNSIGSQGFQGWQGFGFQGWQGWQGPCCPGVQGPQGNIGVQGYQGISGSGLITPQIGDAVVKLIQSNGVAKIEPKALPIATNDAAATAVGNLVIFGGGVYIDPNTLLFTQTDAVFIYDTIAGTITTTNLSQAREGLAATTVGNLAIFAGGTYDDAFGVTHYSPRVDIYDTVSGTWSFGDFLSEGRSGLVATTVGNLAMFAGGVNLSFSARVDIYDSATGTWTNGNYLGTPRVGLAATTVGNLALFAGGNLGNNLYSIVNIYNVSTNTWSQSNLSTPRSNLAATSVGNLAIFAGGTINALYSSVVDIYNADTDSWTITNLSQSRGYLKATTVGNYALFAGGNTAPNVTTKRVDIYNYNTNTWTNGDFLGQNRSMLSAASTNNFAYFMGGENISVPMSNVDIFYADDANWYNNLVNTLSVPRIYLSGTGAGTSLVFAGGITIGNVNSAQVDIFNTTTKQWIASALPSGARYAMGSSYSGALALFGGGVFTAGVSYSNNIDIYNTITNTWTSTFLNSARGFLAATALSTTVLFGGGETPVKSNAVDFYDVPSGSTTSQTLSEARSNLTATSVGDQALFAGGINSITYSAVVDIYHKYTNTWTVAALSQARSDLASTSVGNLALFAGGQNGSGYSNVVDIYDSYKNVWFTATLSQARAFLSAITLGNIAIFAGGISASGDSNVIDIYNALTNTWSTATLQQARGYLAGASANNYVMFAGGGDITHFYSTVDFFELFNYTYTISPSINSLLYFNNQPLHSSFFGFTGFLVDSTLSTSISSNPHIVTCSENIIRNNYLGSAIIANITNSITSTTKNYLCSIVGYCGISNIALLTIQNSDLTAQTVIPLNSALNFISDYFCNVVTFSDPLSNLFTLSTSINDPTYILADQTIPFTQVQIKGNYSAGMIGAPLINTSQKCIGMLLWTDGVSGGVMPCNIIYQVISNMLASIRLNAKKMYLKKMMNVTGTRAQPLIFSLTNPFTPSSVITNIRYNAPVLDLFINAVTQPLNNQTIADVLYAQFTSNSTQIDFSNGTNNPAYSIAMLTPNKDVFGNGIF